MIQTGVDIRVKTYQVIENQLPEFILDENPKASEFLKQYYISQEYQSGPSDISENLDQYLKLDNLIPEVVVGFTSLTNSISLSDTEINVVSTKGYPNTYGLFKIDDEIVTYTGITTNSFTGCIRGFSGITSYRDWEYPEELVFSSSVSASHSNHTPVQNLSSLFLKEFYKKLKYSLTPGLENLNFVDGLNAGNFIKESKALYRSKGTPESFRILYNILYGITPKVVDLENYLFKPSSAEFLRRDVVICEAISGNPNNLVGQTIESSISPNTRAAVSEVEIFKNNNRNYYKLGLFIGFNDDDLIEGKFNITGNTRIIGNVSVGSSIITVDSTIGFPKSGQLISDDQLISYTDKTINQFLNCSGIYNQILSTTEIRSNITAFGYENGDLDKKVEIKILGSTSTFVSIEDNGLNSENSIVYIKNLGDSITNFAQDKTYKQIFANSFVYNTACTFEVSSVSKPVFTVAADIDDSNLIVGDTIEIINNTNDIIVINNAKINNIDKNTRRITLTGIATFTSDPKLSYSLRRVPRTASSNLAPISYGNNNITANIQNIYFDDEYSYVASNSLPSYEINVSIAATYIGAGTSESGAIQKETDDLLYSIISFPTSVPFITGDVVVYRSEGSNLIGLEDGRYFVEVIENNKIKLFDSPSFIYTSQYRTFSPLVNGSSDIHQFFIEEQSFKSITPQKLLKKIPLEKKIRDGNIIDTTPGGVGITVNGIELLNYKSNDKVYYGPIQNVNVISSGSGYDVINPPIIEVATSGSGTTSYVRPVIRGEVNAVYVDPANVDIEKVLSFNLVGGNGFGAKLEPVLEIIYSEFEFDAREINYFGGVDIDLETITFLTNHNFVNGESVLYNSNGNPNLGIGTFGGDNYDTKKTLSNNAKYYVKFVNSKTIKLFPTFQDYISGINTVGFTTIGTSGIHKIRSTSGRRIIRDVRVANPGSGYENRKIYVSPSGISTENNLVIFKNHRLNDGDLINYAPEGDQIVGLSTESQYYVLKKDDDSFRLSYAGIGGTISDFYNRRKYELFPTQGTGYQIFQYPDIRIEANILFANSSLSGIITATPFIRGPIVDAYLYEVGSGYGSSVVNFEKKPVITIKTGIGAEVSPVIINGRIIRVEIKSGGREYYSSPDLIIEGDGQGSKLRPIIDNGRLIRVVVVSQGIGYSYGNTKIRVVAAGKNAKLDCSIRSLSINEHFRHGNEYLNPSSDGGLQYAWFAYPYAKSSSQFSDDGNSHSPIIGWAYDGNPIYGPYGYNDPVDSTSGYRVLTSGYIKDITNIEDRPDGFESGFFVDDYKYVGRQDLDLHNGRFCKTPEFPNGRYAYFAGIATDGLYTPTFPYFIGNRFKSIGESQVDLDQDFDFENSLLFRNTFPYRLGEEGVSNDFIDESNSTVKQKSEITSVTKGGIDSIEIIDSGNDYAIGDYLKFDNTGTSGDGAYALVSSLKGKSIVDITTNFEEYSNVEFIWKDSNTVSAKVNPYHTLNTDDTANVAGLSTNIRNLSGYHKVNVLSGRLVLLKDIVKSNTSGIVTDIYVSTIPNTVSVGNSVGIGTEILSVLNVFKEQSVLRVKRGISGINTHSAGSEITKYQDIFDIKVETLPFTSKLNDKVFFNPKQSVGLGSTAGVGAAVSFYVGDTVNNLSIPTQSIYIPNHPFNTNQRVILSGPTYISVANTSRSQYFNLLDGVSNQNVYIINKTKDHIGIVTQIGLTTSTNGLYFLEVTAPIPNNYEFSLESDFDQVTGSVQKAKSVVSVSTSHLLQNGDTIKLTTIPNSITGIGTSSTVKVEYSDFIDKIIVNSISFGNSSVNVATNTINIPSHNFETGDLVYYTWQDSKAEGLQQGRYFVYRVDEDNIKLSETFTDATSSPITTVDIFTSGGSYQSIGLINPPLPLIKGNTLELDLSHPSLSGYEFKIFTDREFKNNFVSIANTTTFTLSGIGTVGVSSDAKLSLNYAETLPASLYYNVEKLGQLSTVEDEVIRYSEIYFIDSSCTGEFNISGIGTTTFNICLKSEPESYYYNQSNTETLEYTTTSTNTLGPIDNITIISKGKNYKKVPIVSKVESDTGANGKFVSKSNAIGKISSVRIINTSYDYPSDKTLRPQVNIPKVLRLKNSSTLDTIELIYGGSNYISPPDLVVVDTSTGTRVDNGVILANLESSSITSLNVVSLPTGMNFSEKKIFAINNSNGVGISTIQTSSSGIVTCFLITPTLGFSTTIFNVGEKIFVERIEKNSIDGDGFNSEDYGFEFFIVSKSTNTNPATIEYSLSGFTTNTGIGKTIQQNFASVVKYTDYPRFSVNQKQSLFAIGEAILVKVNNTFVGTDLTVSDVIGDYIKLFGDYQLKSETTILGAQTGSLATIQSIIENKATFDVESSSRSNFGWKDDRGKLNVDDQVLPDNDYYQNLSYTVKSPIEFEKSIDTINRMVHSVGTKNFADTEVLSTQTVSIASSTFDGIAIYDLIEENRVDTIAGFAIARDTEVSSNTGKYISISNKKLLDAIICKTNRVLDIDSISKQFANKENVTDEFIDIVNYDNDFSRFLVQVRSTDSSEVSLTEVIVLYKEFSQKSYTLRKGSVYNTDSQFAEIFGYIDEFEFLSLRFEPNDPYNVDYDIKIIQDSFTTSNVGYGSTSIGFINKTTNNTIVESGTTSNIVSYNAAAVDAFTTMIFVVDKGTLDLNFVEIYASHDGTNTYISEYYHDTTSNDGISAGQIGEFSTNLNSGVFTLNFNNDLSSDVLIQAKTIGFGNTSIGIGTSRFIIDGQTGGTERSARFESFYSVGVSTTNIINVSKDEICSIKSTVSISIGSTSALYQIIAINDTTNTISVPYPFLSVGSTTGLGTFGTSYNGSQFILQFHPDNNISGNLKIKAYSELIYTESDIKNNYPTIQYGTAKEELYIDFWNAFNGDRINKTEFDLNYKDIPIFVKTFNPSDTSVLDKSTGIFTINEHFFSTGEELIYNPASTFAEISSSPMGIGATLNNVGIVTNILPRTVYAIKINPNSFKVSTRKNYAELGIGVTFTSIGLGNAHEFEMVKKNEKCIISVDEVIQSPLTFTPIVYTLIDNSGVIGVGNTIINMSGISSIVSGDILKIDDEFMKVSAIGLGTQKIGPITGIGTYKLLGVERGFVGTSASSHLDGSLSRIYKGSFNIVGKTIHFTGSPKGSGLLDLNDSNLPKPTSTFNGRVFLRQKYDGNLIYDDISQKFNGIGQTFRLSISGVNTSGIQTGSGISLLNGIYQTPTTENNSGNNYLYNQSGGYSNIIYTGITSSDGTTITNVFDVNQNQLPRGGLIVSLGTTTGLGFAPLVGASVTAVVGAGGSIVSVGLGTTDRLGSGYNGLYGIGVSIRQVGHMGTSAIIQAKTGIGGTLSFNIVNGGTGYTNPQVFVSEPTYENLPVKGVSRRSIGSTSETGFNLLIDVEVGEVPTVGIGSTLFEVKSFKIARQGYGFQIGDVFKPVGLVTDKHLSSPLADFELTVVDVFYDSFTLWQFGELDYIDSIKPLQNGTRTVFPLKYNSELLSFEIDKDDADSSLIDLDSILIVFLNGVLQSPGESYSFVGGSSISFTDPLKIDDNISIYFYNGTRGVDVEENRIAETIKIGDIVQLKNPIGIASIPLQDSRYVTDIASSDKIATNLYFGKGIDNVNYRLLDWTKQKADRIVNGDKVYKVRDSIESQIYPTSRIIKSFTEASSEFFVDDASSFIYEENESSLTIPNFDGLIVQEKSCVSAALSATISNEGKVVLIDIANGGLGYSQPNGTLIDIKFTPPTKIGVGIGSTASATITVINGSLTLPINITNSGLGYTSTNPPQLIVEQPAPKIELFTDAINVEGRSGIITGISTSSGIGTSLALKFFVNSTAGLNVGYPIYIFDTSVGNGVTSIDNNDSQVVAIGKQYLNNVYYVHSIPQSGEIITNIKSNTKLIGIGSTGGLYDPLGKFSWGRISSFNRKYPIAIALTGYEVNSVGLSSFPSIQRRGYGLRDNGSYRKILPD